MNDSLTKIFKVTLYEEEILITTRSNRRDAFQAKIIYPEGKGMMLLDRNRWAHDWLETTEDALNYYECCGILILFGITPASFHQLCQQLGLAVGYKSPTSEDALMGHFKPDAS